MNITTSSMQWQVAWFSRADLEKILGVEKIKRYHEGCDFLNGQVAYLGLAQEEKASRVKKM